MLSSRMVSSVALACIVAQLVVRAWLAATGNFYWDDLVLIGRASSHPILSWEFLGHSHDGHFMPAAFLVAGVSTALAPVQWVIPAITLVVMQAVASLAVWRMIRVIAPRAGMLAVVALVFYLFSPMTVPAFTWWAAALNSLPMQAAMAWIVADAVRLARGEVPDARRRGVVIRCAVIFLVALTFFEKSLFILPVALAAATLAIRFADDRDRPHAISPLASAVGAARGLWAALSAIFVAWVVVFFSATDQTAGVHSVLQTAKLVWRSVNSAIIPALVGGPWTWDRWIPSPPAGFAPWWMIVAGWLVLVAVAGWAWTSRRGAGWVLGLAVAYAIGAQIPIMWNRSSGNTALELAQTMRYLPDTALVLSIALALVFAAPRRTRDAGRHVAPRAEAEPDRTIPAGAAVAMLVALVVASSMISLTAFADSWRNNPTGDYLANAKRSLAANRDHRMFDQSLPLEVLLPVTYPNNQISHVFGRVRERPDFGTTTDRLNVLDSGGRLVPGAVTPARTIRAGDGACDRPEVTGPRRLQLDGALLDWRWTIQLPYCADRDGEIEVSLGDGDPVRAPVRAGLNVVYVQLDGTTRDGIGIRPVTAGLALHTGAGRVGEVVEARYLPGG